MKPTPGVIRLTLGALLIFGAAGALDGQMLSQASSSVALLALGMALAAWGAFRMEGGRTLATMQRVMRALCLRLLGMGRGLWRQFLAQRYLRRVARHQARLKRAESA